MRHFRDRSDWFLGIITGQHTGFEYRKVEDPGGINVYDAVDRYHPINEHFRVRVKLFRQNDYYGPRTQDLIERAQSFFIGTKHVANASETYSPYKLYMLDTLEKQAIAFINEHCKIAEENLRIIEDEKEKKEKLKAFEAQFQLYLRYFKTLVFQVLGLLLDGDDEQTALLLLKEISEAEFDYIAKKGRPSIIHQYRIPKVDGTSHQFLSCQQVVTQLTPSQLKHKASWDQFTGSSSGFDATRENPHGTNPSTTRNTESLSNFLRTSFVDYNDPNHPKLLFEGFRHSSYPPIMLDDPIRRHAMAMRNAEQLAIQVARHHLANEKVNPDGSITVDLSSLSLLSDDWVESFRRNENEIKQIEESVLANRFLNQQKFTTTIDGKRITIYTYSSFMTMGCNKLRNWGWNSLQQKINCRGFVEHMEDMRAYLSRVGLGIPVLQKQWSQKLQLEHKGNIERLKRELTNDYLTLQSVAEKYEQAVLRKANFALIEQLEKCYHEQLALIKKKEEDLDKIYEDLYDAQKKLWGQVKNKIAKQIRLEKSQGPARANIVSILSLYYDLNALYLDRDGILSNYAADDYYFQFQARYLISAFLIGKMPDFFCKSGEDRTGRINNIIEELLAEYTMYGVINRYDEHKRVNKRIAPYVHDFSASRETTKLNAWGARGLQITRNQGSDHLLTHELDRTLAITAKNVYPMMSYSLLKPLKSIRLFFKSPYKKVQAAHLKYHEEKQTISANDAAFVPTYNPRAAMPFDFAQEDDHIKNCNRVIALLSEFNLDDLDKQFSRYLKLIYSLEHRTDDPDKEPLLSTSDKVKQQLQDELNNTFQASNTLALHNPWMEKMQLLIDHKQKLRRKQQTLMRRIELKTELSPNKKCLESVNHVIALLDTKQFLALSKKHALLQDWKTNPDRVSPNRIGHLAPKHYTLTLKFPFIHRVHKTVKNIQDSFEKLQTRSISHLLPDISRLISTAYQRIGYQIKGITERFESHRQSTPPAYFPKKESLLKRILNYRNQFKDFDKIEKEIDQLKAHAALLKRKQEEAQTIYESLQKITLPFEELIQIKHQLIYPEKKTPGSLLEIMEIEYREIYQQAKTQEEFIKQEIEKITLSDSYFDELEQALKGQRKALTDFYSQQKNQVLPIVTRKVEPKHTSTKAPEPFPISKLMPASTESVDFSRLIDTSGKLMEENMLSITAATFLSSAAFPLIGADPTVAFQLGMAVEGVSLSLRPTKAFLSDLFRTPTPAPATTLQTPKVRIKIEVGF